jgi:leader peptidase (prepilin peptidase)/N-methyltransferase
MELSCAVAGGAAMAVAPGWAGGTGALFGWLLITLAVLDLRYFWLPDRLTLLLAATGLLSGLADPSITYADRMIGGLAGFAGLWAIAWIYRKARGREGLGGGDPKLFGAIGLWLGWQVLPFLLLGASGVGLMVVLILMLRGRTVTATMRVPFGTLLATAAFSAWLLMR